MDANYYFQIQFDSNMGANYYFQIQFESKYHFQIRYKEKDLWSIKSCISWLQQGDKNNNVFQAMVNGRLGQNRIHELIVGGSAITDMKDTFEVSTTYFAYLLGDDQVSGGLPNGFT